MVTGHSTGHGKSDPDNIGSVIKQIADKTVAQRINMAVEEIVFEILKERRHDRLVVKVSEVDIAEIENIFHKTSNVFSEQ